MRKTLLLVTVFVLVALTLAQADSLVTTRPTNGTDSVNWSQLGASFTPINNPFSLTTANSVSGTGSFAQGGQGQVRQEGNGWNGNFSPGDALLWTQRDGPLMLSFSQPVSGLGANIQADYYFGFTALLQVYNSGGGLIESFSESGYSDGSNDGSAIFIGVANDPSITEAVFSLTSATFAPNDFAINQLDISPVSRSLHR